MGRKPKFTDDDFLRAALDLIALRGPDQVTVAALAEMVGAPIGSLYHRFGSRAQILAHLWLRVAIGFQTDFIRVLDQDDPVQAALHTPRWCREHLREAQVLLLYRREELADKKWPRDILETARKLACDLDDAVRSFAGRVCGSESEDCLRRVQFAIVDIPYAAVARYLRRGQKPPKSVDDLVERACSSVLEEQ